MKSLTRFAIVLSLCMLGLTARAADPATPAAGEAKPDAAADKAALEKKFEELMSGVTLVGHYTTGPVKDGAQPKEERYTIDKVTKLKDDLWLFNANIKYGSHDATLPLPLEVKWAGDTPVITLTKFAVPGFGTFTARVMIYDNAYAGMWNGGDHGGLLYGRLEKKAADDTKKSSEAKPADAKPGQPAPIKTPSSK